MPPDSVPFSVVTSPDATTVEVRGELAENVLPLLRGALAPLEATGGTVVLTAVTFLPSRSVGEIAASRRRARAAGVDLRLVAAEFTIASSVLRVTSIPHDHA